MTRDQIRQTVSVINAAGCSAVSGRGCRHEAPTVAVGSGPAGITVDQATSTVYVTNQGGEPGRSHRRRGRFL